MRRSWLAVSVTMAVVTAGCSGEDVAERVIENRIESESGEDIDIDLDDGDMSIRSEDGEFSIDIDDDDGSISISGVDDGEEFSIESEDGETVFRSEEGETVMMSSEDLPDDFPGSVPLPDGYTIEFSQMVEMPEGQAFSLIGMVSGDPVDVTNDYVAALESAGFAQVQLTTMADGAFFSYQDDTYDVGGSVGSNDDGTSAMNINVSPRQG